MSINFISSKDSDETGNMHTKSNNREIMTGNQTDEIIEKHFWSLLKNYQKGLEESMRGSEFNFDSVTALFYHLQKISLERGGSYIDFPKWLKNTKAKNKIQSYNTEKIRISYKSKHNLKQYLDPKICMDGQCLKNCLKKVLSG